MSKENIASGPNIIHPEIPIETVGFSSGVGHQNMVADIGIRWVSCQDKGGRVHRH